MLESNDIHFAKKDKKSSSKIINSNPPIQSKNKNNINKPKSILTKEKKENENINIKSNKDNFFQNGTFSKQNTSKNYDFLNIDKRNNIGSEERLVLEKTGSVKPKKIFLFDSNGNVSLI